MELLSEKQVTELTVVYENRVKAIVEKIKDELRNRKELKKKLEDAKQREALQIQVLDRLEESEKLVKKQLDLVAKREDNDSLKILAVIKQYERMLEEQKLAWEEYKTCYESLPSVKQVRKAEAKLLCAKIKFGFNLQTLNDLKRMAQMRDQIRKRQEQLQIIRFAELYVEYLKRQKRCRELWYRNKNFAAQAHQLRLEIQEKEAYKQQKFNAESKKVSGLIAPQKLPQVDMSRFIIHREKGKDSSDTMSINSYMLEEEYMNNNGLCMSQSNSQKAMDVDIQDTMTMDVDTQDTDSQDRELVQSNEISRRLDFEGAFSNEVKIQCTPAVAERNSNEIQNHMPPNSSNQSRSQVDEHNRTSNKKIDNHERHSDRNENKNSSRKRVNQNQQQNKENIPKIQQVNNENPQNGCSTTSERPIPTPAKMSKSSFHEKQSQQQIKQEKVRQEIVHQYLHEVAQQKEIMQQQQAPRQNSQETYEQQKVSRNSSQETYQQQQVSRNSSQENCQQNQQQQQSHNSSQEKYPQNQQQPSSHQQNQHHQETYLRNEQRQVPQQQQQPVQVSLQNNEQTDYSRIPSINKPRILSNESVNFNLKTMQREPKIKSEPKPDTTTRTPIETPTASRNTTMPKNESTPFAFRSSNVMGHQSNVNFTPISADIDASSMMSTTMHSVDNNYLLPDNISAILGSEITEPGGSFEFARRIHDLNSEDGDMDYEKMIGNMCSPLAGISPRVQHPQVTDNTSMQPLSNRSISQHNQNSNSNSNDQTFNFGGFGKKQTNTTQRLF